MNRYNEEALNKISIETNISIEELLKKSEDFVIYNFVDLYSEEGNNVGSIIKEHHDCSFKLGELVYSDNGNCSGNLYKFHTTKPQRIKKYTTKKSKSTEIELTKEKHIKKYEKLLKMGYSYLKTTKGKSDNIIFALDRLIYVFGSHKFKSKEWCRKTTENISNNFGMTYNELYNLHQSFKSNMRYAKKFVDKWEINE